ncbi:IS3 family transposase [Paenibacillus plantarum]|uniref:IS3 family transposase n=1 Tax=Paenibacillus plantarum TaxID=2654975 RepID=UPI0028ABA3B2|nr:IS3 family transposase [Paenibacillus plantarum]
MEKQRPWAVNSRGNCWYNAPQESFFGYLTDHVKSQHCTTFAEVQEAINCYIRYYNHHRYQWEDTKGRL